MTRVDPTRGVVLALGGGGVRGVAHLGVLAEFERAGVEVIGIAGTSSGALMGALWLLSGAEPALRAVGTFAAAMSDGDAPDLEGSADRGGGPHLWARVRHAATLLKAMAWGPPVSAKELVARVAALLPDTSIEALPRPFAVVATDSATGAEVRLTRGPLRLAVAASSAMPGLAEPVLWDGRPLQDGGAVAEIPVGAARELGGPVVAVEVSEALTPLDRGAGQVPKVLFRVAAMGWQELRRRILAEADAVIAPAVNHLHWADYGAIDAAVAAGRAAAREFMAGAGWRVGR
ncbi:MAG: patatin-like phospholipase family protein [Thermoanaerobaculaceae bacterium]|nr:patatin-like phospholipase family protein [Thermoanaerobaculaceae bacterium]